MKIRNGFVSNSSSSSFCIVGVSTRFDVDDADEVIKELTPEAAAKFEENEHDFYDLVDDYGLVYACGDETGDVIGADIDYLKDDVTLGDYKKEVASNLAKVLKSPPPLKDIGIIVGCSYDG
jgi:hypothetical protein